MDIGLYREDEQFSFSSAYNMESYSSDSASFETIEQNENDLFEEIRPMPQPPSDIFEWHDGTDKESNCDMNVGPLTHEYLIEETLCSPSQSKEELQKILGLQSYQPIWKPVLKSRVDHLPIGDELIPNDEEMAVVHHTSNACLQEILDLPEIVNSLNPPNGSTANIKMEANYDNRISEYLDSNLTESNSNRTRVSESSDILNTSFNSSDITNFDIAEYVFEENKQSKQSMQSLEPVIMNKDPASEANPQLDAQPLTKTEITKRTIKSAIKKIDLKAQKYIIEQKNIKKSFSEDEDDVDIETVSEEESAPVLEAGDLTDLLEQFEANEVKNQEQNITLGANQPQNLSLKVKVEFENEKDMLVPKVIKTVVKNEPDTKRQDETAHRVKIKVEKPSKAAIEKSNTGINQPKATIIDLPKACQEHLIINNQKVYSERIVKSPEATTSSKIPNLSNNRHIIDSLPQELINRIKESGKRKPITVIQAIPNNRKRSKIQELNKPHTPNGSNTVHLDHNYCSPSVSVNQVSKKDSGFVSSEEDDRTIISRQPTVKNADGTLMVSLLKANTIRHVEPTRTQKKKLNLEEYKKRRNGFLTPTSNSQSCSPNTSTCSSPLPEDEHQKMLKHQEKLRKMAEEVLNAAPKSEKKVEIGASLVNIPILIPLSPVASFTLSQSTSPTGNTEVLSNVEISRKPDSFVNVAAPALIEIAAKVDMPNNVDTSKIPSNLERKVLVSFGVNTDFKIATDEELLAPVEKLQEIQPLLEQASDKINENSLIASVIENIPKIIGKTDKHNKSKVTAEQDHYEHGENKQVLHLEKDRVKCETKDAETQTNISLIEQSKRGRIRRRVSSSSSCSSYKSQSSRRSRKCSGSSSSSSSRSSRRSTSSGSSDFSSRLSYSRSRSRSPRYTKRRHDSSAEREHLNAVEERRIIYVGRISAATSKEDLRKKFHKFGPINKISLHFRDIGENYGFVTFKYKEDAHEAYEHGNDDKSHAFYKISFGGRREFCKAAYSDLDNMRDDAYYQSQSSGDSYDKLLKEALEKLKKRKV